MSGRHSKAKKHLRQPHSPHHKITVEEWDELRANMDELRVRFRYSWRDLSLGCGRGSGWAREAFTHRGVGDAKGLRQIKSLLLKERSAADGIAGIGHVPRTGEVLTEGAAAVRHEVRASEPPLPPPEPKVKPRPPLVALVVPSSDDRRKQWYKRIVTELRDPPFGYTYDQVGRVFGYSDGSAAQQAYSQDYAPREWRLFRAADIVEQLRAGNFAEAERLASKPAPMAKEPAEKREEVFRTEMQETREVLGVGVTRIGPPAKAPRQAPESRPVPQPTRAALRVVPAEVPAAAPVTPAPPPAATNGKHQPTEREGRLVRLKERLMEVAVDGFDDMIAGEPKFVQPAWRAKQDELMDFINSLE